MLAGDNGSYRGEALPVYDFDPIEDMEAFDRLGPLTREALNNCAFRFTAIVWANVCDQHGLNPCHPVIDAQIAATIYRDEKVGIESDPQCA